MMLLFISLLRMRNQKTTDGGAGMTTWFLLGIFFTIFFKFFFYFCTSHNTGRYSNGS